MAGCGRAHRRFGTGEQGIEEIAVMLVKMMCSKKHY